MDAHDQIVATTDAWLATALKADATPAAILAVWEQAVVLLWRRAALTLGEVTLAVIFERVVMDVAVTHPLVAHVTLGDPGPDLRALHTAGATADGKHLRAGLRAFVISYVSLIDALTGGILTPVLRKELEKAVCS